MACSTCHNCSSGRDSSNLDMAFVVSVRKATSSRFTMFFALRKFLSTRVCVVIDAFSVDGDRCSDDDIVL